MSARQDQDIPQYQAQASSRYEIRGRLGEGGLGEVFRAWDTQLGREVAIKRLRDATKDEETWREAQILAALHHPNLVTVYDFGRDYAGSFVVMELVEGVNLDSSVPSGGVALDFFQDFADQLCRGLAAAHARRVVHRDLKPGNIMIQHHDDGTFTVKILDFGLAKSIQAPQPQTMDQNNSVLGSVYYMAPEQLTRQPVDNRTDIYSLGAIFYYVLTGHPPFQGELVAQIIQGHLNQNPRPLTELREDLPASAAEIIHSMLAKKPDDRPLNMETVRNTLRNAFGASATSTTITTSPASAIPLTNQTHSLAQDRPAKSAMPAASGARPVVPMAPAFPQAPAKKSHVPVLAIVATGVLLLAGGSWWLLSSKNKNETTSNISSKEKLNLRPQVHQTSATDAPATAQKRGSNSTLSARSTEFLNVDPNNKFALLAAVGKPATAEGTIVRLGKSRSGDVIYLNFSENFRESLSLVFFVRGDSSPFNEAKLRGYVNKRIRVRGEISEHQGSPQMIINDLSQIEIL